MPTTLLPSCRRHCQATAAASSDAALPLRRCRHRAATATTAAMLPCYPPLLRFHRQRHAADNAAVAIVFIVVVVAVIVAVFVTVAAAAFS